MKKGYTTPDVWVLYPDTMDVLTMSEIESVVYDGEYPGGTVDWGDDIFF